MGCEQRKPEKYQNQFYNNINPYQYQRKVHYIKKSNINNSINGSKNEYNNERANNKIYTNNNFSKTNNSNQNLKNNPSAVNIMTKSFKSQNDDEINTNQYYGNKSQEDINKSNQKSDTKRNISLDKNSFPLKNENNFNPNISIKKSITSISNPYRTNDIFNFDKSKLENFQNTFKPEIADNNISNSEITYSPRYPSPPNLEEDNFYESEITNSTYSTKYLSPNISNVIDYQNQYNYYYPYIKTQPKTQIIYLPLYQSKSLNSVKRNLFSTENEKIPQDNIAINEDNNYINININNSGSANINDKKYYKNIDSNADSDDNKDDINDENKNDINDDNNELKNINNNNKKDNKSINKVSNNESKNKNEIVKSININYLMSNNSSINLEGSKTRLNNLNNNSESNNSKEFNKDKSLNKEVIYKCNKIDFNDFEDFNPDLWKLFYPEDEKFFNFDKGDVLNSQISSKNKSGEKEIYIGDINQNEERHGFGKLLTKNVKKIGTWRNGHFTGWGREIRENGDIYEGKFIDNQLTGKGIYKNKKILYIGDFYKFIKHGKGDLFTKQFHYNGTFYNNKLSGKGKLEIYDQGILEGNFTDNEINGEGIYMWKDGNFYEGEIKNGMLDGKGKLTTKDGIIYEGTFSDCLNKGLGKIIYPNGFKYKGKLSQRRINIFKNCKNED